MLLFLKEQFGCSSVPRMSTDLGSVFTPCYGGISKLGTAVSQKEMHSTSWEFGCHRML